jgi:hypothetical protein
MVQESKTETFHAVVSTDFSAFYIQMVDAPAPGQGSGCYLVQVLDATMVAFSTARQNGDIPIEVRIHIEPPAPLDISWRDVVELSLVAGKGMYLSDWDPGPDSYKLQLPLLAGANYRLRYSISDIDSPVDERDMAAMLAPDEIPEKYLIEFWAQLPAPPEVIVQKSNFGRARLIDYGLQVLRFRIYQDREDTRGTERIVEFAEEAFALFPDLIPLVIDSGGKRLSSAAFMLHEPPTQPVPISEQSEWMKATQERIGELVVEVAERTRQSSSG